MQVKLFTIFKKYFSNKEKRTQFSTFRQSYPQSKVFFLYIKKGKNDSFWTGFLDFLFSKREKGC